HELATNQKTWLRWMIAVSAVAAALALVAGGLALYLRGTKSELENIVLSSRLAQQSKALAAANPQLGVLLAVEALGLAPPDVRSTKEPENALHSALASIGGSGLGAHYGDVSSMALSQDNRWLISGGLDGTARQWQLSAPGPAKVIFEAVDRETEHRAAVYVATARGKIAMGGANGIVRLDGQNSPLKADGPDISALALDASGHWLAAGDKEGAVWLWNLATRGAREIPLERLHQEPVEIAEFSQDGHWLVTANRGNFRELVVLWRLDAGQTPRAVKVATGVSTVDLNGDRLALGFRNGTVQLWRIGNAGAVKTGETHLVSAPPGVPEPVPTSIALNANGEVVVANENGAVFLWDGVGKAVALPMQEDREHKDGNRVTHLAISPGGTWLVAAYAGGSVRLRPLGGDSAPDRAVELRGHNGPVETIVFSPARPGDRDSRWLFTGGSDGTVRRWDLAAADPSNESVLYRGQWIAPRAIVLSPDRRWLIAGDASRSELSYLGGKVHEALPDLASARFSEDSRWLLIARGKEPAERSFRLHRLIPGRESELVEELRDASAVAIAPNLSDPNDAWLVSGQKNDGSVWIRRIRPEGLEERPQVVLAGGKEPVNQIVITPDRRYVVVSRAQGTQGAVQIWRLSDRRMVFGEAKIGSPEVAVSPNNRWLAFADAANVTRILDLRSPQSVWFEVKNSLNSTTRTLTSDNRMILGFEDGTVKSYLLGGKEREPGVERVFEGHRGPVFSVAVSRDNRFLATGGSDGTARVWN